MDLQVTMMICPENKWNIKCPYSMNPQFIVVHNTANNASAMSEISYMIGNNYECSYHFAVDDTRAVQGLPLNRNAWHASDGAIGKGNRQGIGIEICYSIEGGERFKKSEQNAAYLIAQLLMERGWGIDKVKKHQDFCSKRCPHRTLDMGWQRFLNMVKSYMIPESTTIYSGIDYSAVYDKDQYVNKYSDLKRAFGDDAGALIQHFATYGVKEGRQGNNEFDVQIYRDNYADLQKAFKDDLPFYYIHYINYGKKEGRIANKKILGA